MAFICPECGAVSAHENTCQEIFDNFLILEFTDASYGAVHFLTVASFMIQHGRYSDEGLAWIQVTLRTYLEGNMTPTQLRQYAAKGTGSDTRTWKVLRQPDSPPPPKIAWSMTIVDVAENYKDAESYCELVKQWAQVTLQELASSSSR